MGGSANPLKTGKSRHISKHGHRMMYSSLPVSLRLLVIPHTPSHPFQLRVTLFLSANLISPSSASFQISVPPS